MADPVIAMKFKSIMTIALLAEIALVAAFIWCVWKADKSMDKTGTGNLELSQQYNSYAGAAISTFVALWVATILVALFGKHFKDKSSQIAIGLPPLLLALGLLSLWL
jgi:uncharacterized membrane protein